MDDFKLLIDGRLVDGDSQMDVINPATETAFASAPRASARQFEQAIAAAKKAFPAWSAKPIAERRALILRWADQIEAQLDSFARLLTQEQGKPLAESTNEVFYSLAFIRSFANYGLEDRQIDAGPGRQIEVRRRPLGVVAAVTPWNFPMLIGAVKLPFALLAGNTVVLKPAPTTPLTSLRMGVILADIFPAGVVNIVTDQNDLGGLLTSHPDIAKVSFTGSTETGRKVMQSAAATLKRLTLELGGNDPAIVLADADPAKIAPALFNSAFANAGQVCIAVKRVYAHKGLYDQLCTELARLADEAVVDDGLSQGAQIGPLQNAAQFQKVKDLLAEARRDGNIVAGGNVPERPGFFVRPTIVRDIQDGTRLVDEEQFGPILPIISYSDTDDVIRRANATPYGLGASVWSSNREEARRVAARLEAGTSWINVHGDIAPDRPFSGAKQSGFGVEFAEEGLAEFTQIQVITEVV